MIKLNSSLLIKSSVKALDICDAMVSSLAAAKVLMFFRFCSCLFREDITD